MTPKCMINVCFLLICVGGSKMAQAQSWEAPADRLGQLERRDATTLYDENRVPDYVLPPLLVTTEGLPVRDARQWVTKRRPEILSLFERFMFGRSPVGGAPTSSFSVHEAAGSALDGLAKREQVRFEFARGTERAGMDLLLYLPREAKGPTPVFLILNFGGNHTISVDPSVERPKWPEGSDPGLVRSLKSERGDRAARFPLAAILGRGYGLATVYYEEMGPDRGDAVSQGVRCAGAVQREAGSRWLEFHRGLGLGAQPGHGLPGGQSRCRFTPGHRDGAFSTGQDGPMGGGS